jgi:sodium/potassium/calcium exchanger 6
MVFKRATFDGVLNKCWLIVELPLNILRDYTCPMAEYADWNRNRATIIPMTFIWGFLYLQGFFNPDDEDVEKGEAKPGSFWIKVGAYTMIPMVAFAIYIKFMTKVTQPPVNIMFLFAIISFVNSISWIGFTCDIVVDLLTLLGQILSVPKAMLGFTLLAWGNCLGDMQANVAMTKKGFGEMAITGCMAGPIFNILMGLGLATIGGLLADQEGENKHDGSKSNEIPFSLYNVLGDDKGKINP